MIDPKMEAAVKKIILAIQCYDFGSFDPATGDFQCSSAQIDLLEARCRIAAKDAIEAYLSASLPAPEGEPEPISAQDPMLIIAGIKQFGLASDGSDLRDLQAVVAALQGRLAACEASLRLERCAGDLNETSSDEWRSRAEAAEARLAEAEYARIRAAEATYVAEGRLAKAKAALTKIADGLTDADAPDVMTRSLTPTEFRSEMWSWSQRVARTAIASITGGGDGQ